MNYPLSFIKIKKIFFIVPLKNKIEKNGNLKFLLYRETWWHEKDKRANIGIGAFLSECNSFQTPRGHCSHCSVRLGVT